MAIEFDLIEHKPVAGPALTLVKVNFRPSPGEAFHSNIFHMQLYPTGVRLLVDGQGRLVTESGKLVVPLPDGSFPDEDSADRWRRETFARNNDAEMVANIEAYWERKLRAAAEGKPWPQHHNTTLNLQVGAGTDDAHERDSSASFDSASQILNMDSDTTEASRWNAGFRFTSVTIGQADTIDSAVMQVFVDTSDDDPNCDIYGNDVDDAADFSTEADVTSRTLTTANVLWNADDIGTLAFKTTPSIVSVIQEIVDRGTWSSGNALVTMLRGRSDIDNRDFRCRSYDDNSVRAAKLDVDFTAVTVGVDEMMAARALGPPMTPPVPPEVVAY